MNYIVTVKNNKIILKIDNKDIKIDEEYCFIMGTIYNLDSFNCLNVSNEKKIIELYKKYGNNLFSKLNGEYTIILIINNIVYIFTNIIGINNVYYFKDNNEIKCTNDFSYFLKQKSNLIIDKQSLSNYICYSYINAPRTIIKDISKLEMGKYIEIKNGSLKTIKYFDLYEYYKNNFNKIDSYNDAFNLLHQNLISSIKRRCNDKKKIGIFLSSGIDSTLLLALTKKIKFKSISTYTVGFYDKERNEADLAKKISNLFNVKNITYYIKKEDAIKIIKNIPEIYDEPFADPSIIPTIFLNDKVSKNLDIILTGDGADQLFMGSNVYDKITYKTIIIKNIKNIIKSVIYHQKYKNLDIYMPKMYATQMILDLPPESYNDLEDKKIDLQNRYMLLDITHFLASRLMTKIHSPADFYLNNISSPFIDTDVIKYSLTLSKKYKYNNGKKKYILRNLLNNYIPYDKLSNNSKRGFGIPLKKWLYSVFYDDIIFYSNIDVIRKQGLFPITKIQKEINRFKEHILTSEEYYIIFSFYIFEVWYQKNIEDLWEV